MPNHKRTIPIVRVTVSLDEADHAELPRMSSQAEVSLAWLIRRAAKEFIERQPRKSRTRSKVMDVIK
jgi:Ribbon-helix-helix protein, copG family